TPETTPEPISETMPEPVPGLLPETLSERGWPSTGAAKTCSSSPCWRANFATKRSSSSDSAPRSLWLTCATESTIPSSARSSSSRQSKATESAPPETAAATRSPARIECCFRIVCKSRSASSCTEKWYRKQYLLLGGQHPDFRQAAVCRVLANECRVLVCCPQMWGAYRCAAGFLL